MPSFFQLNFIFVCDNTYMRILVAEDEESIAKALKVMLEKNKYTVDIVFDGQEALNYIENNRYDVLVLDIMMPKVGGIEVLKNIRNNNISTPVLFLSAKSEVNDKVLGLDAGADDYLTKPFSSSELLARIKALSRRSNFYMNSILRQGNTTLDLNTYNLSASEKQIKLNNKEFQLLELFFKNPGKIFSSEHLMDKVWDIDSIADIDVVWTYIGFLRRKLKTIDSNLEIKTIRGVGYCLEEIC